MIYNLLLNFILLIKKNQSSLENKLEKKLNKLKLYNNLKIISKNLIKNIKQNQTKNFNSMHKLKLDFQIKIYHKMFKKNLF